MISTLSLWLPILLSAVFVFIASSIIHMATPWHASDVRKAPDESKVMETLRPFALPPGDYAMPRCESMADMKSPEYNAKLAQGPVMMFTVVPSGPVNMGRSLALWFLYSLVIALFAAWLCARMLPAGTSFGWVACNASVIAFLGYAGALWQQSIWWHRSWLTTIKGTIDGLLYGAITGLTIAWLWPVK